MQSRSDRATRSCAARRSPTLVATALLAALASGACIGGDNADLGEQQSAVAVDAAPASFTTPPRLPPRIPPIPLPTICSVDRDRELVITDLDVVNDPARTTCSGSDPASCGVWTFGHLMAAMAGTTDHSAVSRFTHSWLKTWSKDQTVNSQTIPARLVVESQVTDPWVVASGGNASALDFSKAPFRLLAIVNRVDLRGHEGYGGTESAGEGRFVFGVLDSRGRNREFTVIFEYKLPATACGDVKDWANRWHDLGTLALGSAAYNAALEDITEDFAGFDANPRTPTGSSISQVRTNEFLTGPWELREFELGCTWIRPVPRPVPLPLPQLPNRPSLPTPGPVKPVCIPRLAPATVKQSPADSLRNVDLNAASGAALRDWMDDNQDDIRNSSYIIPETFNDGSPFLGSHTQVNGSFAPQNMSSDWDDLRAEIALNSCAGCHQSETGTAFLHIRTRGPNSEAGIFDWLDTIDLPRREADLCRAVNLNCGPIAVPRPPPPRIPPHIPPGPLPGPRPIPSSPTTPNAPHAPTRVH